MKLDHSGIMRQIGGVCAGTARVICGATAGSFLALFAVIGSGTIFPLSPSQANEPAQYQQVSPEIIAWAAGLTNALGIGCCTIESGIIPTEVVWDMSVDSYRVKLYGQWLLVPDEAVINAPNRFGHAAVWYEIDHDIDFEEYTIMIRCFLPGAAI